MMKNSKLKFSEYMQNISRSKSFGKFVLIVYVLPRYTVAFVGHVKGLVSAFALLHKQITLVIWHSVKVLT